MQVVAFLRAINVGGRRVTNDELVAVGEACGFSDVRAFLASGNLLFHLGERDEDEVRTELEETLEDELGHTVECMLRSAEQLDGILAEIPWSDDEVEGATSKPHVVLLQRAPDDMDAVEALATDSDLVVVRGRELHWLPVGGMQRPTFDPQKHRDLLGPATARNTNTIARIRAKLED